MIGAATDKAGAMGLSQKADLSPSILLARNTGLWIIAIIAALALPKIFDSRFSISMMNQMGIAIIFSLSYNMLLGQGGMLSFGHAVFYGMGGFGAIHVMGMVNNGETSVYTELLPLAGGLFSMGLGLIIGFISTRKPRIPFALITMGVGELLLASSLLLPSFFGGEEGISGDRMTDVTLTGMDFARGDEVYLLIIFWMFVSVLAMYLLTKTPLGQMANAVRDNSQRARFIGYDPHKVRTFQFTLAAFFAGIAGGLFAINYEIVTAENLGMAPSADILMMTFIGGVTHFAGPIIGAVFITFLQLFLSNLTHAWMLYFGALFIGMVIWAPEGIAGLVMKHKPVWKAGLLKRLLPPYVQALVPALMMLLGTVVFVELNYHLSLSIDPESPMHMFGLTFKAQAVLPWIVCLTAAGLGLFLFLKARKKTILAWRAVEEEMKGEDA